MIYHGPDFVETEISERTFRSGLVERKFQRIFPVHLKDNALETLPENLFPAPVVSYDQSGMGRIECMVYDDDSRGQPVVQYGMERIELLKSYSLDGANWSISEIWRGQTVTVLRVILASKSDDEIVENWTLNKRLLSRRINGERPQNGAAEIAVSWTPSQEIVRRNFGVYDEAEITCKFFATI